MPTAPRFLQDPRASYFLFGPRGTGKSTWLRGAYPDALWLDLLDVDRLRTYEARPERLRDLVESDQEPRVVVIDEVQKVPQLLDVVHSLIERRSGHRFVLTGSSPRKLKRAGVNLLAGRAVLKSMHPFLAAELGESFSLERALRFGTLPLVWFSENPAASLATYVGLYLKEEIHQESLVRSIGDFARFLESISFSHAGVLNLAEVARECEVSRTTVQGYLEILEDLLLAFRVLPFTKRAKRHLAVAPKFYWFDAGVFAASRPAGPLDRPEEIAGAALEGLVAQHLRAWVDYSELDLKLHFWRTKGGSEVDFVLYGRDGFHAIEVKNTKRVRPEDLRSLKNFRSDYPEATARLLYRGDERLLIDGISCIPCEAFLRGLAPGLGLG